MSYSTFLESQNKNLRDSLHEWKEKCRQDQVIIKAKDDRIQELESAIRTFLTKTQLGKDQSTWTTEDWYHRQAIKLAKVINPPQQQQPEPPHTNQDQIPPRNPEPRLLDSRTGF